jgi:hypothetical protein
MSSASFERRRPRRPNCVGGFAETGDLRTGETVFAEIVGFLRENGVRSVAMPKGILGCPHEEGIDYPSGGTCPDCLYWAGRDRWAEQFDAN